MANTVLAMATSHSPSLQNSADHWLTRTEADRQIVEREELGNWAQMIQEKAHWIHDEIAEGRVRARHAACQQAIEDLADILARVQPDVLITIGDDHREVFSSNHMPPLNIHWADQMLVLPFGRRGNDNAETRSSTGEHIYPGRPALGEHLIASLTEEEFDISHSRTLEPGQSLGHTFDFVCRRIMREARIGQVPLLLNTYYAPNRPTARRCYALGRALRRAVDSWESDERVAIIASGGLTHTVVDESVDRAILAGIRDRDETALTKYPEQLFVNGTSEIKAWIVLAGAMEEDEREMRLLDYIPCYRTVAGTGCGMAFAYWE